MNTRTFNEFSTSRLNHGSTPLPGVAAERKFKNLGTLQKRVKASGKVTVSVRDEYDFRLKKPAKVEFNLFNTASRDRIGPFGDTKARVQATLFNDFGKKLKQTSRIKPQDDAVFRRQLSPGEYTVRITGRSDDKTGYKLRLNRFNA